MAAAVDTDRLKMALIDAYRDEIRKRYDLSALRKLDVLDSIPDEKLVMLRSFFLEHVYPPATRRPALDAASELVGEIFRSPRRLMPLLGIAATSLWRLGTLIPSAARVTAATLESLQETRRVERYMLEYAIENDLEPEDFRGTRGVAPLIASIPEDEMIRFRNDVIGLFRSMNSAKLLRAGVEIMTNAIELMERRSDTYDDADVEGFKLGRGLLEGSLALYERLAPGEAEAIVDGIEQIEAAWYEKMKRLAAEKA